MPDVRQWDEAFDQYRGDPRAQLRAIMTSIAERNDPGWLLLLLEGAYAISQTMGGGSTGVGYAVIWASEALVEAQLSAGKALVDCVSSIKG
jgi:hypothetical protein